MSRQTTWIWESRAALLEGLNDYRGAVILVSHDKYLLDACADRLWLVDAGTAQTIRRRQRRLATSIFTAVVMVCQCLISPSSQVFASASDLFGTILKFCLLSFSVAPGEFRVLLIAANSASSTGFGVAAGANRPFQATVPTSGYPTSFIVGMSGYSLSRE